MQNKKAFEMTISTLILLILGVVILLALILAVTGGIDRFKSSTKPFLDSAEGTAIKAACQQACNEENKLVYCCQKYEFDNKEITCLDPRLELDCTLTCEADFCSANRDS